MAKLSRACLKASVLELELVIIAVVLCCFCNQVLGEIEKDNRILPTNFVASATESPLSKEGVNETTSSTSEGPEEAKPSDWTPMIILVLFLFGAATVGIPSIVSYRMKEQRQAKIVPKQRKYTVSLTLVDPNEANGFTRL